MECVSPPWDKVESVEVSVSLNGKQFSLETVFVSFKEEPRHFTQDDWIVAGLASIGGLLLILLVALWIRHVKKNDGYKRLQEGNQEIRINDVKLHERIGKGTFGEVFRAQWRGAVIALKKMPVQSLRGNALKDFQKEINLMKALRHPNVLQYLGSCVSPPDICIALEYMCRGSLYSILHNPDIKLSWGLILRILTDASRGMLYLHSCKPPLIHRDLKSHNLLVDESWKVKVCDFGLSTYLDQHSTTMTACGTPCWTAPEVLRHLRYTEKADIYSFGVVMWECTTREDPFAGMPPFKVIFSVGHEGMRLKLPDYCPFQYQLLAKHCWNDQPAMRPGFQDIVDKLEELSEKGFTTTSKKLRQTAKPLPKLDDDIPAIPSTKKKAKGEDEVQVFTVPVAPSPPIDIDEMKKPLLQNIPTERHSLSQQQQPQQMQQQQQQQQQQILFAPQPQIESPAILRQTAPMAPLPISSSFAPAAPIFGTPITSNFQNIQSTGVPILDTSFLFKLQEEVQKQLRSTQGSNSTGAGGHSPVMIGSQFPDNLAQNQTIPLQQPQIQSQSQSQSQAGQSGQGIVQPSTSNASGDAVALIAAACASLMQQEVQQQVQQVLQIRKSDPSIRTRSRSFSSPLDITGIAPTFAIPPPPSAINPVKSRIHGINNVLTSSGADVIPHPHPQVFVDVPTEEMPLIQKDPKKPQLLSKRVNSLTPKQMRSRANRISVTEAPLFASPNPGSVSASTPVAILPPKSPNKNGTEQKNSPLAPATLSINGDD
eukprot:TRINITY_DN764_c0_g1_i2.p1 TRINITY_DN764_c0_g1~~TRINITY_DN764_c0_g1_i2.p1  ORF type:complete len:766 (-),score=274.62 TRINITY_DN764_c0_g1_i2:102-2399(-)